MFVGLRATECAVRFGQSVTPCCCWGSCVVDALLSVCQVLIAGSDSSRSLVFLREFWWPRWRRTGRYVCRRVTLRCVALMSWSGSSGRCGCGHLLKLDGGRRLRADPSRCRSSCSDVMVTRGSNVTYFVFLWCRHPIVPSRSSSERESAQDERKREQSWNQSTITEMHDHRRRRHKPEQRQRDDQRYHPPLVSSSFPPRSLRPS